MKVGSQLFGLSWPEAVCTAHAPCLSLASLNFIGIEDLLRLRQPALWCLAQVFVT